MRLGEQFQALPRADPTDGGRHGGPAHGKAGADKEGSDEGPHQERSQETVDHQDDAEESAPQRLFGLPADGIGEELEDEGRQKHFPQPAGAAESDAEKQRECDVDHPGEAPEGGQGENPLAGRRFQNRLPPERVQTEIAQMKVGSQNERQGGQHAAEKGHKHPAIVLQEGFGHRFVSVFLQFFANIAIDFQFF